MRQILLSSLLFFLSALNCFGQENQNSLLWKLESEDLETSYIFGTIHLLPQKDFELIPEVDSVFNICSVLALELDLNDPELETKMLAGINMLDGKKIEDLVTKEEYTVIDQAINKANSQMSLSMVSGWKPFMLSTLILPSYIDDEPASFELKLFEMAMVYNKEIIGIENIEEQLGVFDVIPYEKQASDILEMIESGTNTAMVLDTIVDLYKSEKVDLISDFMQDYYRNDSLMLENLLYKRNVSWVPRIISQAKEESTFFAVGAGHLGGEKGILALLRKEGYILTPIGR